MHSTSKYLLLIIDVGIFSIAAILAGLWRVEASFTLISLQHLLPYVLVGASVAAVTFHSLKLHLHFFRFFSIYDLAHISVAVTLAVLLTVLVSFSIFRLENVPRALPLLHWPLAMVGMLLLRQIGLFLGLHKEGQAMRQDAPEGIATLIIGYTPAAELYLRSLPVFGQGSFFVAGILDENTRHLGQRLHHCQVIGHPAELDRVLASMAIHGVVIQRILLATGIESLSQDTRQTLEQLSDEGRIDLCDYYQHNYQFFNTDPHQSLVPTIAPLNSMPLSLQVKERIPRAIDRYEWLKRAIDISLALILGVLTLPIILIIVVLIRTSMGHNVIFWQDRPGKDRRIFRLYKFRSLGPGLDENGNILSDNERQTKVGNLLRRTRLDELPQLFNILIGDMSLVGPRPLLPVDLPDDMPDLTQLRSLVRPGMTGWAQINGGQAVSPEDKMVMDAWYLANISIKQDMRIVFKTIQVVLKGEKLDSSNIRSSYKNLGLKRNEKQQDI